jgi:hypothetical protein
LFKFSKKLIKNTYPYLCLCLILVLFQTLVVVDCLFHAVGNKDYRYIDNYTDLNSPLSWLEFEVVSFVETQTVIVQLVVAQAAAQIVV